MCRYAPVTAPTVHFGNHMGQSLPANQLARDRPGFVMEDLSLGQEARKVCVVNTFDRRSPHWAAAPVPLRLAGGGEAARTVEGVTAAVVGLYTLNALDP